MAKETMIVFVYDTECCQNESDDPVEAVLYFHPSWVSDTQKLSLCGQLMGTTYFLKECFFKPKIIALQNGKFVLKEFGRFILAVGTDRNLSDSLLEHRAELLTSLLKFFHRDIQTIYDQFSSNGQYKNISDKLYHIFETYLPILQYNGNIFQNISTLRLPKSASNIFLDAMQTLQSCQQTKGVLGGTVLYHNKVVATQLSPEITKNLVLTDPFHIKSSAEPITVDFHVPIGVQMLIVYISLREYQKLSLDAQRAQNVITQNFSNNNINIIPSTSSSSSTAIPFQFQKRKMKRDKSLIFTNIPEEGNCESVSQTTTTTTTTSVIANGNAMITTATTTNSTTTDTITKPTKTGICRPNHLPLKFKNVTSKEIPESGFASINFDESDSYPEFIGRTSVCSTPMTENKILQYDTIMSICANPTENLILKNKCTINNNNNNNSDNKKLNNYSLKIDFDKFFTNFVNNPHKKLERRNSFTDLQDCIKKLSKRFSIKSFSKQQNNNNSILKSNESGNSTIIGGGVVNSPDFVDDIEIDTKKSFRTITDPMYPVFNSDGEPISKSLFQEFLEKYYKTLNDTSLIKQNNDDNDDDENKLTKLIEEFKEFDSELNKYDDKLQSTAGVDGNADSSKSKDEEKLNDYENDELQKSPQLQITSSTNLISSSSKFHVQNRKALSLPLKPLNDSSVEKVNQAEGTSGGIFERKKHSGIQLTPLMAKLSILALNEERSSGFCSWDTTPGVELTTPVDGNKTFRRRSSIRNDDIFENGRGTTATDNQFQKVELYICGQQNMTLLLLLEEGAAQKKELVQAMFDTCVSKLTRIEAQLNQTLNVNVDGDKSEGGYSYIYVDSKWDTLQRGGPWSIMDMDSLEHMHQNLNMKFPITDLLLRTDESVLYGYKCGRTEFFYKQPAHSQSGLPPPADAMGTISMKAKRRLERDYSLIIF